MNKEMTAVHHKPLKEVIFDFLHERIIAGQYPPGEWLRQEDISSQLKVSMTPVREALDLLVSSGLAERVPYRGVRVLRPSEQEIGDSYAMRLLLECAASYSAALNVTTDQLEKIKQILEESKPLVNLKDMSRERFLNREFHSAIVSAAGNAFLNKMYLTTLNTFPDWMLYEYMFRHPDLLEKSIHTEYCEHLAIVDALNAHDPCLAVKHSMTHLTNRGIELEIYLGIPSDLIRRKEDQILPLLIPFTES